ncbi:unnamed protein product [Clonostachys byssicola]|uniref:Rhodopsin domain-containing protein n=1 Tax=Clonostachys byssicola TaxID=160290 RepID=A0A9N9URY0_9HYPO|nr:unnamed protein product [Clonostachys byssicola]
MPPSHPDQISLDYVPLLACSVVFTFLSFIVVVLRFLQRIKIRSHWYDDWTAFASLIFSIGMMTTTILGGTQAHAGYAAVTYSALQLGRFSRILLAYNVLYNWSLMASKLSILFFFYRMLVVDTKLQRLLQCVGGAIVASCIAVTLALILSNNPIQGTTINSSIFWISTAALNLVFDIAVLMAPQANIWRKHMPIHRKSAIGLLTLLGFSVCVFAAVRLAYVSRANLDNMTFEIIKIGIWSCLEANLSIICACLPSVYSLFRGPRIRGPSSQANMYRRHEPVPSSDKMYHELGSGAHLSYPGSYHVRVQSPSVGSRDDLTPLGPIRVERSYGFSVADAHP